MKAVLLLAVAGCGDPLPPCTFPAEPPTGLGGNVVLIVLDDIGVDKIGAYEVHDQPAPTPNLDALAAQGVRFRAAYGQPYCSPARAAMLTGRRAVRTGVGANAGRFGNDSMPQSEVTLPEALAELDGGWATAAVGKWHLANLADPDVATDPLRQGFDTFDGLLANAAQFIDGTGDGSPEGDYAEWQHDVDGSLARSISYLLIDQADAAIAAVENLPEPFFLYVAMSGAHAPLHVPPDRLWGQADPVDDAGVGDAMIEATDHEVGRILQAIGDRATVIVTADNGTSGDIVRPPAKAGRAKGTLYPGGIHVPLIIAGPGVAPAVSDALVHLTDVFPTVLDLAGLDAAALGLPLDGRSLVPLLDGVSEGRRCLIVDRFLPNGDGRHSVDAVTVIEGGYQMVRNDTGPDELYLFDPLAPVEGEDLLAAEPVSDAARSALRHIRTRLRRDEAR